MLLFLFCFCIIKEVNGGIVAIIKQKLAGNIDFDYKWYDIYITVTIMILGY